MFNLIELFSPYLFFISFLITLLLNALLIYKGIAWYNLIIANVILTVTMNLLGLGSYDFITVSFQTILDLIIDLIAQLFTSIGELLTKIIEAINPFK